MYVGERAGGLICASAVGEGGPPQPRGGRATPEEGKPMPKRRASHVLGGKGLFCFIFIYLYA